jgi:hypothetical protein
MSSSSSSSESALRMDAALVPVRSERSCSLRGRRAAADLLERCRD